MIPAISKVVNIGKLLAGIGQHTLELMEAFMVVIANGSIICEHVPPNFELM
jgi:hypothetical protein